MSFHLELVKDGKVLEGWKCRCNAHALVDSDRNGLSREVQKMKDLLVVRLKGRNLYIFDRKLFYDFTRHVARTLKREPLHLILNVADIGYISELFLKVIFRLKNFLEANGKSLCVIHPSPLFKTQIEKVTGTAQQYLFKNEEEALFYLRNRYGLVDEEHPTKKRPQVPGMVSRQRDPRFEKGK